MRGPTVLQRRAVGRRRAGFGGGRGGGASFGGGGFGGGGFGAGGFITPWVKRLLIANAAVFLVMGLGLVPTGFVVEWLAFAPGRLLVRPWTPLTYMFVHGGFGHLFVNMLTVFFFGPPLERAWGSRFFIKFYLVAGLGGALFSLLLLPIVGSTPVIGASGAVFGLLLAFAMKWPDAPIYLYFLFPVKAKWLVAALGAFTLYATFAGGGGNVAHWAHLGGLVTGFVYLRFGERLDRASRRAVGRLEKLFFTGNRGSLHVEKGDPERPTPRRPRRGGRKLDGDSLDEVDRILDKIREGGMESLTAEERAFLDEMSRRYKETRTH